jgi:RimJ/RimL family protein N-acetyltransferase
MLQTIETDRLTLRQIEMADDAPHAALWAKLDVIRYFQPQPERAVEFGASNAELYGELWRRLSGQKLLVPFAVIERSTGSFIGDAGVTTHSGLKVPEFTTLLDNIVWRRVYGTECGVATLR